MLDHGRAPGLQGLLSYTLVPVNAEGCVTAEAVAAALRPGTTAVVSLMHANNETGALQPVAQAAAAARAAGALVHCDAAQSIGKARAGAGACMRRWPAFGGTFIAHTAGAVCASGQGASALRHCLKQA